MKRASSNHKGTAPPHTVLRCPRRVSCPSLPGQAAKQPHFGPDAPCLPLPLTSRHPCPGNNGCPSRLTRLWGVDSTTDSCVPRANQALKILSRKQPNRERFGPDGLRAVVGALANPLNNRIAAEGANVLLNVCYEVGCGRWVGGERATARTCHLPRPHCSPIHAPLALASLPPFCSPTSLPPVCSLTSLPPFCSPKVANVHALLDTPGVQQLLLFLTEEDEELQVGGWSRMGEGSRGVTRRRARGHANAVTGWLESVKSVTNNNRGRGAAGRWGQGGSGVKGGQTFRVRGTVWWCVPQVLLLLTDRSCR